MINDDIYYCHYHATQGHNLKFQNNDKKKYNEQNGNKNNPIISKQPNNNFKNRVNYYNNDWPNGRPGFIYIYTYKLLYDSILTNNLELASWLQIDNSILLNNKNSGKSGHNKGFNDNQNDKWSLNGMILCKIGMTTKKNVELRLDEWRQQCYHDIINLTPTNTDRLLNSLTNRRNKSKTLTNLFKFLSLKENKNSKNDKFINGKHGARDTKSLQHIRSKIPSLITYHNGGFYNDGQGKLNLLQIEDALHQIFWKKYGKGIIKCSGCYNGSMTDDRYRNNNLKSQGRKYANTRNHIEWFYVPIKDLPNILMTIDNFCLSQTSTIPGKLY